MHYLICISVVTKPDQGWITWLNWEKYDNSSSGMELRGFVSYTSSDTTELHFSLDRSESAYTFFVVEEGYV